MKLVKILIVKMFMNLDTALRKPWGKKKKHTISLRMNEIPGAHLETVFSLSIQSYYKWFCTENCFKHMTGPCSRYQFQSADSQVRLLGYNTQTHC